MGLLWATGLLASTRARHDRRRGRTRAISDRIRTFADFWPYYLSEHARPLTRALHYVGTTLVVAIGVLLLASGNWWLLLAMPVAGYFFAWIAHFGVEKNRPATFTYPLWSLAADFRMWAMALTGRLGPELDRAGVPRRPLSGGD